MVALICFVLAVLASPFKSKSRLEAEELQTSSLLIATDRQTNQLRPLIWNEAKCLTNLAKKSAGMKTPADFLSKLPALFERRLSGQ
jgi:hypothetical protein